MRQFMNLSSIVINKLHITEIVKNPGYMTNSSVNGFMLCASGKTTYMRFIYTTSGYLFFNRCNKSAMIIVLFFLISGNKNSTCSL